MIKKNDNLEHTQVLRFDIFIYKNKSDVTFVCNFGLPKGDSIFETETRIQYVKAPQGLPVQNYKFNKYFTDFMKETIGKYRLFEECVFVLTIKPEKVFIFANTSYNRKTKELAKFDDSDFSELSIWKKRHELAVNCHCSITEGG